MPEAAAGPQPVGTIWRMVLTDAPPPAESLLPAHYGRLGPEATDELALAMGLADASEVRRRFEGGRHCHAAWVDDALAAYGWISFEEEDVGGLGLHLRLRPDEAYIWDCATAPGFRRQGLYAALLGRMTAALLALGLRQVWIGADYANQPSQAGILKAGFTAVGDLVVPPALPGDGQRRASLRGRPGIAPEMLAEARRVFMGDAEEVWLPGPKGYPSP